VCGAFSAYIPAQRAGETFREAARALETTRCIPVFSARPGFRRKRWTQVRAIRSVRANMILTLAFR